MLTRRQFLIGAVALGVPMPLDKFQALFEKATRGGWARLPIGERTAEVAKALVGTPYVGWTLETSPDVEACTVVLDGLDCVTLFETSLGFARMLARRGGTFDDLVKQVAFTRYRGGKVNGYLSRLHYTCDWMADNAIKGVVERPKLSGEELFNKPIRYMSDHPDTYRQLKAHPELMSTLKRIEEKITDSDKFFVPKARLAEAELRTGDIVGITTEMEGMDCSHTGLIVSENGRARFLHASSTKKEVVLDGPISDYLAASKSATGLMVVRPLEVRKG